MGGTNHWGVWPRVRSEGNLIPFGWECPEWPLHRRGEAWCINGRLLVLRWSKAQTVCLRNLTDWPSRWIQGIRCHVRTMKPNSHLCVRKSLVNRLSFFPLGQTEKTYSCHTCTNLSKKRTSASLWCLKPSVIYITKYYDTVTFNNKGNARSST